MRTLLFCRGDREILRYPLTASAVRVGRHPSNDLTIPDADVSRFHLVIENRGGVIWASDLSRNGTTVNGRRIRDAALKSGDRIGLGPWSLLFHEELPWGEQETLVHKKAEPTFHGMLGQSRVMKGLFEGIERVAPTPATVLILGETGSGKEMAARAVHELSPRSRKPFIAVNCGAISPQLMESELFGHERGAFTGAVSRHSGVFEQGQGGTIFLDEIGELSLDLQPKLLRVLEERRIRRVGCVQETAVDVRIVAATHRDLKGQVKAGRFREDLFFRLYAVPLAVPSLRERKEDIGFLAAHFLSQLNPLGGNDGQKRLSKAALQRLEAHPWRGNVRELKNVITRSILFASGEEIGETDLAFLDGEEEVHDPSLQGQERAAIVNALKDNAWNKTKTALALGIAKSTLFQKIKEYGIRELEPLQG